MTPFRLYMTLFDLYMAILGLFDHIGPYMATWDPIWPPGTLSGTWHRTLAGMAPHPGWHGTAPWHGPVYMAWTRVHGMDPYI